MMFKKMIFLLLLLGMMAMYQASGMNEMPLLPTLKTYLPTNLNNTAGKRELVNNDQFIRPKTPRTVMGNADAIIVRADQSPGFLHVLDMVVGRVPGVWVTGNFNNYRIRIRGSQQPPLIVIDGLPFYGYGDQEVNDLLRSVPVEDVDFIEIYKNAASAAIFGGNAGSGVIVIHTLI